MPTTPIWMLAQPRAPETSVERSIAHDVDQAFNALMFLDWQALYSMACAYWHPDSTGNCGKSDLAIGLAFKQFEQ